jgi:hypothetical protein
MYIYKHLIPYQNSGTASGTSVSHTSDFCIAMMLEIMNSKSEMASGGITFIPEFIKPYVGNCKVQR